MPETKTPPGGAPSAEDVQEPDPATAEDPPADLKAGDEKRNPA
ncbi:MAG: hypothetical protein ACRDTF_24195 [Pseudonocardiaceae bacterium]